MEEMIQRNSNCFERSRIKHRSHFSKEQQQQQRQNQNNKTMIGSLLLVFFALSVPVRAQSDCSNSESLTIGGSSIVGSTTGNSVSVLNFCPFQGRDPSNPVAWYTVTGEGRMTTVSTCYDSTNFQSSIMIFEESKNKCEGNSIQSNNGGCAGGDLGDGCELANGASVTFAAKQGVSYWVLVSGREAMFGPDQGTFRIRATQGEAIPPPTPAPTPQRTRAPTPAPTPAVS